jgi:hypothetical protein
MAFRLTAQLSEVLMRHRDPRRLGCVVVIGSEGSGGLELAILIFKLFDNFVPLPVELLELPKLLLAAGQQLPHLGKLYLFVEVELLRKSGDAVFIILLHPPLLIKLTSQLVSKVLDLRCKLHLLKLKNLPHCELICITRLEGVSLPQLAGLLVNNFNKLLSLTEKSLLPGEYLLLLEL